MMVLAGLVAGLAFAGPASSTLLGEPLEAPLLSFDNGGTTSYDAVSDVFSVDANPIALRLTPSDAPIFITPSNGEESFTISILLDDTGALIGGDPAGADLRVFGRVDLGGGDVREGELLTGEVTGFGFQDDGATDLFDFSFTLTGGLLADQMGDLLGVVMQSERSSFANSFEEDFEGGAKGTLGVVPEPTAILLLGSGIAGLALAGRRRAA
jgi:hypothetical protein